MAKRTVNIAIMAYTDAKGKEQYGFRGDEVDVHADSTERFDELNDVGGAEFVAPVIDNAPLGPPGPDPLDKGDGNDLIKEPSPRAHLSEWQAYAEQEEVALAEEDGTPKTKKQLIAELTGD